MTSEGFALPYSKTIRISANLIFSIRILTRTQFRKVGLGQIRKDKDHSQTRYACKGLKPALRELYLQNPWDEQPNDVEASSSLVLQLTVPLKIERVDAYAPKKVNGRETLFSWKSVAPPHSTQARPAGGRCRR